MVRERVGILGKCKEGIGGEKISPENLRRGRRRGGQTRENMPLFWVKKGRKREGGDEGSLSI